MKTPLRLAGLLGAALSLAGCDAVISAPPPPLPPVDVCLGLEPITLVIVPDTIRVNGAATVTATGGSGRYTYSLEGPMPVGTLSGTRYVAGLQFGSDAVRVADDCGNSARGGIEVKAAFEVQPSRASVRPATRFSFRAFGVRGVAEYTPQGGGPLPSGGSIDGTGLYTAGPTPETDVVLVRDSATGEQAAVVVTVSPDATFRPSSAMLALPSRSFIPLETLDGTGVVRWSIADGGGAVERRGERWVYVAPDTGGGAALLTAQDELLDASVTVKLKVLTELERPGLRPQGRRTDTATMVTGDFDGDGEEDLALGVPESDLARPQGGAVFIFKGSRAGFAREPEWIIKGQSDTAQFGAVMAAGDLDGDGRVDLAISAPGDDVTVADSGAVYLYGIGPNGPRQLRPPLTGLGRGNFGAALAIADVDGDRDADLVVGSPGADIAPGGAFTARGVVDIFLLEKGSEIPDLGAIRVSGYDLDADGGVRRFSNLRAGRALVAEDLNADGLLDLAILGSVNNSQQATDGGNLSRNIIAAQVHLGRDATKHFEDTPDLYVLPANLSDSDEGTWRLGFIPAGGGHPALLAAVSDRTDSPDLRANDAGTSGGSNGGGALLFDLTSSPASGAAPSSPRQVTRAQAWARIYGSQANIQAGRSFAFLGADGGQALVLGAPYAARPDGGTSITNTGRLEFFSLQGLAAGAVINRPDFVKQGLVRNDVLGTAVAAWRGAIAAHNGRASTATSDFTGRLDLFTPSDADPATWPVLPIELPNAASGQQFGAGIEVGVQGAELHALVGVPNWSGLGGDGLGNEVGAGQAISWRLGQPSSPKVVAEGANTAWLIDGGHRAFGGRTLASDVAMTDFDGDTRPDLLVAAPNFTLPSRINDGGVATTEYALNRFECAGGGSQSLGAVLVFLGQADGTYREGFRAWGVRDLPGCTVPDGGQAAVCQRTQLARNGLIGGFDFDGDGKQDFGATRSNGFEVFAGRAPDDAQLGKPSMACDPLFSFPFIAQATSMPAALGDLDGDGCDEVGFRYSDNGNRQGVVVAFGFSTSGARCGGRTTPSWVRLSGDTETGVATMRLGVAMSRAPGMLPGGANAIAITADLYPYLGITQPTVLLVPAAQLVAKRPSSGEQLVSILGDGLTATPLVPMLRALNFGRALAGGVDLDGDGTPDLVVSATGANVNGDGTGAVYVFKGGSLSPGPNLPVLLIAADSRERAAFGQDLSVSAPRNAVPAAIGIGAPLSYRAGTANGAAFVLPMDF